MEHIGPPVSKFKVLPCEQCDAWMVRYPATDLNLVNKERLGCFS